MALAFECPFGKEKADCVMAEFRKRPLEERFEVIRGMTAEELRAVYKTHRKCLAKREGKATCLMHLPRDTGRIAMGADEDSLRKFTR